MVNTIFRNLISNAYKFTPRGGTLEISLEINHENKVEITIKDSGIGMPKNILDNLFSISVKTNRNGTESEKSSGLGLLLVKEYLEKNNGKVSVRSIENKGTTFTVTLPLLPIE